MQGNLMASFAVIGIFCLIGIQAKIVFINGTEVYKGKLNDRNVTTKVPVQTWYSVFNPRNISNHSGFMTSVHRKSDADEDEARIDEEKEPEVLQNDSLATSK
ncbi:uncharacterized protein NPIL_11531 [Nephila pilipes]|uniref:Uncharacterized protein n=1 Tax=Nephila pilipes TaxID=299642 RepID=A0A8X6R5V8_NEPPI|nr:uncharacterized protein NPIL_11531 [Nephila pilipes]